MLDAEAEVLENDPLVSEDAVIGMPEKQERKLSHQKQMSDMTLNSVSPSEVQHRRKSKSMDYDASVTQSFMDSLANDLPTPIVKPNEIRDDEGTERHSNFVAATVVEQEPLTTLFSNAAIADAKSPTQDVKDISPHQARR